MNLQEQLSSSVQKAAGEKRQNSRNVSILKTGHFGKSIAYANWAVWVKKFFLQKYAENESTRLFNMFCAKNRWKKQPIFENETILKKGHFGKSIAHAKWALWVKNFFFPKFCRK